MLSERFKQRVHNQVPGLYCGDAGSSFPPGQLARVREGDGGPNIRIYFCDPDGRVVRTVTGFVGPERLLREAEEALREMQKPDGRRIEEILREVEDDVYRCGAVG